MKNEPNWQELIEHRMEAVGLTQKQSCYSAGVDYGNVNKWLRSDGTKTITAATLERLCDFLGLELRTKNNSESMSQRMDRLEYKVKVLEQKANEPVFSRYVLDDDLVADDDVHCPGDDYTAVG